MAVTPFLRPPGGVSLVLATMVAGALLAPAVATAATRHHIGLSLGYTKLLSDELKDEAAGIDFTNAGNGILGYRFSLTPMIDLCIESRATVSTDSEAGVDLTLTNSYVGPGVRVNGTGVGHPFGQVSVLFASEEFEAEQGGLKISGSESGVGFAVAGGVDMPVSPLLSVPIELHYLYAKPEDDVSGLGLSVGLTFNFGLMQ